MSTESPSNTPHAPSTPSLGIRERLAHSTARLECKLQDGRTSVGTGFFFQFSVPDKPGSIPIVVTNRHVIEGGVEGSFRLTLTDQTTGLPRIGQYRDVQLPEFERRWICHPDANVDLCVLPIAGLLNMQRQRGGQFAFAPFDRTTLPSDDDRVDIGPLEEVVMIGYPIGLWDAENNIPIFRRGITATNPNHDHGGRSEFVIDAACFPGSSGSPVLLYNPGMYTKGRNVIMQSRLRLLGILYAGPVQSLEGDLTIEPVPTHQRVFARTAIPVNLGYVIKAHRIWTSNRSSRVAFNNRL